MMKWFWSIYSWFWWRIPSNRKRWREMLLEAIRTNKFSRQIKAVSNREWIERIEKEAKIK